MRKLRLLAASSAAGLALLVPAASTALAADSWPVPGTPPNACTYYTDFDVVGGQLHAYDSKVCGNQSIPAYVVIEKVGSNGAVTPVAYGTGIVSYTCQGSAVNTYKIDGDINRTVTLTPGAIPCG